ncbi:hypothetical protein [Celeribacter sp.]|uniref:hypothetical protein n=1 Tax=Celeribacter sp. TaxID=1890673 RepID=UPI003A8E35A9
MLGIVIWTDKTASSSLIYCSDGRDLAYADGGLGLTAQVGTLVQVDLSEQGKGFRKCTSVRNLGVATAPDVLHRLTANGGSYDVSDDFEWMERDAPADRGARSVDVANSAPLASRPRAVECIRAGDDI